MIVITTSLSSSRMNWDQEPHPAEPVLCYRETQNYPWGHSEEDRHEAESRNSSLRDWRTQRTSICLKMSKWEPEGQICLLTQEKGFRDGMRASDKVSTSVPLAVQLGGPLDSELLKIIYIHPSPHPVPPSIQVGVRHLPCGKHCASSLGVNKTTTVLDLMKLSTQWVRTGHSPRVYTVPGTW